MKTTGVLHSQMGIRRAEVNNTWICRDGLWVWGVTSGDVGIRSGHSSSAVSTEQWMCVSLCESWLCSRTQTSLYSSRTRETWWTLRRYLENRTTVKVSAISFRIVSWIDHFHVLLPVINFHWRNHTKCKLSINQLNRASQWKHRN